MRAVGMDPKNDFNLVAVGLGAPPIEALRSDRVQALLFWASAQASFENAGLKLRYFRGPDWRTYPDFSFTTLQKTIDADADRVVAIARGAAKASVFAMANPDCVRRLHWARWPDTKPSGADEATLIQWDLNNLKDAFEMNGGELWGKATPEAYGRIQDLSPAFF